MNKIEVTAPLEELLEHANWVRRLAGGLVAGPHEADDITQDVWQAVLTAKPGTITAPRGWLAGAVRNVVNMRRRSSKRREQRELQAAKPDETPTTADLVADQELRTELIQCVDQLPEGERQVVLLRFWRNLPPREVAKQLGIPVNTVRSRTARALDRLRAQLDEQHGDRRTWCLMLVPLLDAEVLQATALAPATSTAKIAVLAATTVMVLGVGGYAAYAQWFGYSPPDYASTEPVAALLDAFDAPVAAATGQAPASERQSATPPRTATTLAGQVVDLEGRPIAGAFVHRETVEFESWVRRGKIAAEDWSATTDAQGNFLLPANAFDFLPPRDTVKIGEVTHDHYVADVGWTDCVLGETARFVMRPTVKAKLEIEVVEKGSNVPVPRFAVTLRSSWGQPEGQILLHSRDPGCRHLTSINGNYLSEHGHAGVLQREVRLVAGVTNQLKVEIPGLAPIVEELALPARDGTTIRRRYEVDVHAVAGSTSQRQLRGKVIDAMTGKPIYAAYVALLVDEVVDGEQDVRWLRSASHTDGSWLLHYDPSLPATSVVVQHPDYTDQVFEFAGEDALELQVLPLASLELTVTTEGRPQPGVHVLLRHARAPARAESDVVGQHRAVTDERGQIRIDRLPIGALTVCLVPGALSREEEALESINLTLMPGAVLRKAIAFANPDRVTVQGKVYGRTMTDVPLAPAFIPLDNDHGWTRARSQGGSTYQAGGVRRGRYLVFLLPISDDYREGPFALARTITVDAPISQVFDFELPAGTVSGRLQGIENPTELTVVAIPKLPQRSQTVEQLLSSPKFARMLGAQVDLEGGFRLARVADGRHDLQLRRGAEGVATRSVDVQGGFADVGDWLINQ